MTIHIRVRFKKASDMNMELGSDSEAADFIASLVGDNMAIDIDDDDRRFSEVTYIEMWRSP